MKTGLLFLTVGFLNLTFQSMAQTTAFTYQGRLDHAGATGKRQL